MSLSKRELSHSPQQAGFEFLTQHPPKSPKRRRDYWGQRWPKGALTENSDTQD